VIEFNMGLHIMEYLRLINKYQKMSKTKDLSKDDWRRQGQEKYLNNIILIAQNYHSSRDKWEHDHCEFC